MKKIILTISLIMGFASAVYAASFCCGDGKTKDECCAERGKIYCPSDETCRTRCPNVTEPDCIGGCINPEGVCCDWCPSMEVCKRMGKCQKIVDGCYECVDCPEPNPCTEGQCLNEEGVCCDSCPRTCPDGQCLVGVDGCYECGECPEPETETTEPVCAGTCEVYENGQCVDKTVKKYLGDCCDSGTENCCPLTEDCNCYPIKEDCSCPPPNKISSEGECCPENWLPVTEIDCTVDGLCYEPNDGCPLCVECETETTETEITETTETTSPEPDDDDDDDDEPTEPYKFLTCADHGLRVFMNDAEKDTYFCERGFVMFSDNRGLLKDGDGSYLYPQSFTFSCGSEHGAPEGKKCKGIYDNWTESCPWSCSEKEKLVMNLRTGFPECVASEKEPHSCSYDGHIQREDCCSYDEYCCSGVKRNPMSLLYESVSICCPYVEGETAEDVCCVDEEGSPICCPDDTETETTSTETTETEITETTETEITETTETETTEPTGTEMTETTSPGGGGGGGDDDDDDDDDDTETTEPDLCVGKPKYKDCCECNPSTGAYDLNCTKKGEKTACCNDVEAYNPNTHECCDNKVYAKCPDGQTRNPDTCACECPEGLVLCDGVCCSEGQVCCDKECKDKPIPDENKCERLTEDECGVESKCIDYEYNNEELECCKGQCVSPCDPSSGTTRNPETCACECPEGLVLCDGVCCGEGQECCGGKCIDKCTGCTTCIPENKACSSEPNCPADKPTCCNGQCICGDCCDKIVPFGADGNSTGATGSTKEENVVPCSYKCTPDISYSLTSGGTETGTQYDDCRSNGNSEKEVCEKTYYTKDGQCKLGQYFQALDACCNPIEDRFCCTATDGDSCMSIGECKEKFGPVISCGDWCCTDGKICADASTHKCCPADAPNLCGSECCSGACNADNTGCCSENEESCACKEGYRVCGSGNDTWCCGNSSTCGNTKGQCCGFGGCCENGATPHCGLSGVDPTTGKCDGWGEPECCPAGSPFRSDGFATWCCPASHMSLFTTTDPYYGTRVFCCGSDSYMSSDLYEGQTIRVHYDPISGKEVEDYSCISDGWDDFVK